MYHQYSDSNFAHYEDFIRDMSETAVASDSFDPALYQKYNVKRGLRNADSTGVLVGLTSIGDVRAYIMEENEKVPIDGKLYTEESVSSIWWTALKRTGGSALKRPPTF